ncbi:Contactin-associated protein like 5-2 [Bagarius yarrelli]|uniref:Contactin-associated protein like 5-2 n=1 Tax=Bagarius yarrelli TaxID=175774 RepID=A0A556U4H9_BAGYA|nr:Contactin-associated protein like 5-2 [Bagarius yarrelli]
MELQKWRCCALGASLLAVFSSAMAASHYSCDGSLTSGLPVASFKSSSHFSESRAANFAKLNRRDGGGGWSPQLTDRSPWLQLDLRARMEVTAVATQGRHGSHDWVSGYTLLYSDSGSVWRQYRNEDRVARLVGNLNSDSAVYHKLSHPIRTRFLKFVPLEWNPSGRIGLRVDVYGCTYKSYVADFDGRSSLLYRFNQKSMSTVKDVISLRFKSRQTEGVLLHGEGQRGDYITLELHRGRLALHLNLDDTRVRSSSGRMVVTLGSLLDDQHWHSVLIERFNKQVNFTLDRHTQHFRTKGDGDSLEVDYELSFGGIPLPGKPGTFLRRNFHGCMENLYYNSVNVIDLAKRRKPQIYTVGNVTFSCSEPQLVAVTFPNSDSSFLSFPAPAPSLDGFSVRLQFRTWNPDGLLLSCRLASDPERRYLLLSISSGRLQLTHHTTDLKTLEVSTGQRVNDGLWHSVSLSSRGLQVIMTLDNEPASSIQLEDVLEARGSYYFGGCPVSQNGSSCMNTVMAFQGCMRLILINNQPVDLMNIQQGIVGSWNQIEFDICGIQDREWRMSRCPSLSSFDIRISARRQINRITIFPQKSPAAFPDASIFRGGDMPRRFVRRERCLPNLCENGGRCSQTWSAFSCDCIGTGYNGATCHNSIYEASCEAYRLAGSTSGYFSVDSDGSGPLGPIQVYCNMTEDKVWTVIHHNSTNAVRVQGSTSEKPYKADLNYGASPDQLRALVSQSEYCQQSLTYQCKRSRLFSTWDGAPLSWWLERGGEKRTYWGGLLPGVQHCACSLEENCIDMNFFCNCDADRNSWENDTGILSYKDDLPVSGIVIGDTNRVGSEAIFNVGPLQCSGDKSLWNAASFYDEASYLLFPVSQMELSFDVSFYFKTGSPSGVFVENVGSQDFIRVELSSSSVATFSFNAGYGPTVLNVKSPVPLNDRQWHWVRAERNVKEASLQVDQLPLRFLEPPAHTHIRLQLNNQLFVGGTASRQRGFLGCMRALTVNGVTFDLDERAKVTPGVSSGCAGHCSSSAGVCHNRGKCVEKSTGYVCDCTHSAYGGPSCKEEVSVSFERGSSVTYIFQEPFSVIQNRTQVSSSSAYSKSRDNIALNFLTTQSPAMLLTVNTFTQQYVAVILARNGSLQIWYRLHKERRPSVFSPVITSLADGKLHRLRLHREGKDVYVQVDQDNKKYTLSQDTDFNSMRSLTLGKITAETNALDEEVAQAGAKGFVGCFSSVQYNHVAPLKAALLNRGSSLVSIRGHLLESNCGALADLSTSKSRLDHGVEVGTDNKHRVEDTPRDSAVIGGVVTAVVFVTLCLLAVMARFLYQHRQLQRTNSIREKEHRRSLEAAYRAELHLNQSIRDSMKEYYI